MTGLEAEWSDELLLQIMRDLLEFVIEDTYGFSTAHGQQYNTILEPIMYFDSTIAAVKMTSGTLIEYGFFIEVDEYLGTYNGNVVLKMRRRCISGTVDVWGMPSLCHNLQTNVAGLEFVEHICQNIVIWNDGEFVGGMFAWHEIPEFDDNRDAHSYMRMRATQVIHEAFESGVLSESDVAEIHAIYSQLDFNCIPFEDFPPLHTKIF